MWCAAEQILCYLSWSESQLFLDIRYQRRYNFIEIRLRISKKNGKI